MPKFHANLIIKKSLFNKSIINVYKRGCIYTFKGGFSMENESDEQILKRFERYNEEFENNNLGPMATSIKKAVRRVEENDNNYRSPYARDADRILHSLSFSRYFDKTQVFFWINSDMHSHRMLHVQLVNKIARHIGKYLKLNMDLIESIALGHDIGHAPFGHDGEEAIDDLCKEKGIGRFFHNYESVHFLQNIEMQNLTLQTIDGILAHNGEVHHQSLEKKKDLNFEVHDNEMNEFLNGKIKDTVPGTNEGVLVRYADVISYISRDVLDAENLKILKFSDIPDSVKETLGKSNREIINSLINDLLINTYRNGKFGYSEKVIKAIDELYEFNKERLYLSEEKMSRVRTIKKAMRLLWDKYERDYINKNYESEIYQDHIYLNLNMIQHKHPAITLDNYPYAKFPPLIVVRDFIAGMTDQYFWHLVQKIDPSLKMDFKTVL